ncbi:MAG: hypothetical protein ACFFD1_02285 [Candidatus Thorarchaeota archaeon]
MTKADIERQRDQFQKYSLTFKKLRLELEPMLPKIKNSSFDTYSIMIKPDLDKILYTLSDLEYQCSKIKEDKIIKKYLQKEFNMLHNEWRETKKIKQIIEENIPKQV